MVNLNEEPPAGVCEQMALEGDLRALKHLGLGTQTTGRGNSDRTKDFTMI